jgi:hypothetical protein
MLYNKFLGQSRSFSGSTNLDINPILKIREGYVIGTTTEYVNVGEYRVISMSNYGYDAQKVNLNAKNEFNMMTYDRRVFSNKYPSGFYYYNDFNDSGTINDFSFTESDRWGITAGYLQRGASMTTVFSDAVLNSAMGLESFVLRTRMRSSSLASPNYAGIGLGFKIQDVVEQSGKFPNLEAMWIIKELAFIRSAHHVYLNNGYNASESGQSLAISDNTWYDYKLYVDGYKIKAHYRANVATDWVECYSFATGTSPVGKYLSGGVGFVTYSGSGGRVDFDLLEVQEIRGNYTRADLLSDFARQRNNTISIENEFSGFSTFFGVDGATFILGETNGYQQLDMAVPGVGASWMVAMTSGFTFNDFVLDFEFCGPTGSLGPVVGTTSAWVCHYRSPFSGVGGLAMGAYGASRDYYHGVVKSPHINLWMSGRLVKSGPLVRFYVNGDLASSYSTTSLGSNGNSVGIGMACYRGGGATNARYSFRNLRMSSMDDLIDDTEFGSMGNIANDFNRLLPDGYVARYFGETITIYKTSGVTNVDISTIVNSSTSENIVGINKYGYFKGDGVGAVKINTDSRSLLNADNTGFITTTDATIKDKTSISTVADEAIEDMMSSDNSYEMNIIPKPMLDKFDGVNMVDTTIGVSGLGSVSSLTKDIEMETGSYGENLVLQDK